MEQQRRISPPQLPATSPASSSPLSGINEDLYELLQSTTTTRTPTCFPDVAHIPKMEPELGDFMGSSSYTTWGAAQLGATHLGTQLYNSNNSVMDNSSSLTCLTNFIQQGTQQLPDIATQFATYTPPPAASAGSGAQIQALRDFMVYGNMVPTMAPSPPFSSSAMSSRATTPVAANGAALGFYHQLDEVDGMQHVVATSIGSSSCIPMPSLAYRALCSEIYASTTERSPHRSQFQRENHILAERQRREEMNEKFSALRAMIPKATKKDKASIVGDTIDYVLELEKRLKQLQACKDTASGGGVFVNKAGSLKRKSPYGSRCEDGVMGGGGGSSSETTNAREVNVNVSAAESPVREAHSAASSPSDQITAESKPSGKMKEAAAAAAEVDVQQLGKQAVVKVVCNRRRGHVLRVLNALEECKVEVLQSNVMTVADNSIHFATVQLEEGVSAPTEELISAVLHAIDPVEA